MHIANPESMRSWLSRNPPLCILKAKLNNDQVWEVALLSTSVRPSVNFIQLLQIQAKEKRWLGIHRREMQRNKEMERKKKAHGPLNSPPPPPKSRWRVQKGDSMHQSRKGSGSSSQCSRMWRGWGWLGWVLSLISTIQRWHGIFSRRDLPSAFEGGGKGNGKSLSLFGESLRQPWPKTQKRVSHAWSWAFC